MFPNETNSDLAAVKLVSFQNVYMCIGTVAASAKSAVGQERLEDSLQRSS